MNNNQPLDLKIREASNRVHDLREALEKAKEKAFQEHELMLISTKRKDYDSACREREAIKAEIAEAESQLNRLESNALDSKYRKDEISNSYAGKNLLNIAFAIFGICAVIFLRKLFS